MADFFKGLKEITEALNKQMNVIDEYSTAGLIRASIIIQRAVDKETPKIPIDTSNLRASFFRVINKKNKVKSSPAFKGNDSGEMSSNHEKVLAESQGIINTYRDPALMLGFSANYAGYVHENIAANFQKGNPSAMSKARRKGGRPGAGAKFLETKLNAHKQDILKEIGKSAKID